jgi:F0F1-type ATP synthase assembly protein I
MKTFYAVSGAMIGPLVVMGFIGYHLGTYLNQKAITIAICLLIGFIVACVDIWKLVSDNKK